MRSSTSIALLLRFFIVPLLAFCIAIPAISQNASVPNFTKAAAADKEFSEHIKAYIDLEKAAEKTLPAMKSSNDEGEIRSHQLALRAKVIEARRGARRGDIFSKDVAEQFRKAVRAAFRAPGGEVVRRTIVEGDASKLFTLQVNGIYPDESPVQTTPPTVLSILPALPVELAYRFVGRSLVLLDNKTNLIVDFLSETLP